MEAIPDIAAAYAAGLYSGLIVKGKNPEASSADWKAIAAFVRNVAPGWDFDPQALREVALQWLKEAIVAGGKAPA